MARLIERARMNATGTAFFASRRRKALNRPTAWLAIRKYGDMEGLELTAHPNQGRHACGFALADHGGDTRPIQDHPGHRDKSGKA
jgi:type 1 fimbriae regulatory protein FimB